VGGRASQAFSSQGIFIKYTLVPPGLGSSQSQLLFGRHRGYRETQAGDTEMAPTPAASKPDTKPPKPLPSPNSDFYQYAETLNTEELSLLKQVRAFMEEKVAPIIDKYWAEDAFPFELLPAGSAIPRAKENAAWCSEGRHSHLQ
jgi:hypothetical protein